ncbi:BspA family leucine-rich repeat surface protein [Mycoplasma phocoeninasale]|uniref:BspA family leucine-rich repeat surface protein n=1 Tax=Mycoplasma phocoeninasale TaxID=2726117 RepID=A0A858U539_9MOLU|nr:BspA family leucine-rich repeat surface protein [Mycoplasma phocoeninasale]QJG66537.1 BspA family leucine-rich repeat surface protein [Mycoplasma phocoeninasale]
MKNKLKLFSIIPVISIISLPVTLISSKINNKNESKNLFDISIINNLEFNYENSKVPATYDGTICTKIGYFKNENGQYQIEKFDKNVTAVPNDLPIQITSLKDAFKDCENFNQDLSSWNVERVADMSSMFENAKKFNQNLLNWNVENVKEYKNFYKGSALSNNLQNIPQKFLRSLKYLIPNLEFEKTEKITNLVAQRNEIIKIISVNNNEPKINWGTLAFNILSLRDEYIEIMVSDYSAAYYDDIVKIKLNFKKNLAKEIVIDNLAKVNSITEDEVKRVISEANVGKNIQWDQLKIAIDNDQIVISVLDSSEDYLKNGTITFRVVKKLDLASVIKIDHLTVVAENSIEEITKLIKAKYPQIDLDQLDFTMLSAENIFVIKAKENSADYLAEVRIKLNFKKNLAEEIAIDNLAKVNSITEDEVKRVISEANVGKNIQWDQLKIAIDNDQIVISVLDSSADYLKNDTITFKVVKKLDLASVIKIDHLTVVDENSIEEITKLIGEKYPQIDLDQLDFTMLSAENIFVIKAKENSADYLGEVQIKLNFKKNLAEEIVIDNLAKVNTISEEEIKRVVNEANSGKEIKWDQLKITITGNNITIKVVDGSADYSNTTHLSFNVAVKIDLTKEIKVNSLGKVNAISEEEIKRVLNEANAGKEIKWDQLKITITGNNITIKVVDGSADYSNISDLSFEISAKQNLNTIIKINETLKVEELTISQVQKLIKAKYPQIDLDQLDFTMLSAENIFVIKAKENSADYLGEVKITLSKKQNIQDLIADKKINFELGEFVDKDICDDCLTPIIKNILKSINLENLNFKIKVDKSNQRILVNFDSNSNCFGELMFHYQLTKVHDKTKNIVIILITIFLVIAIAIAALIAIIVKRKRKLRNKQTIDK